MLLLSLFCSKQNHYIQTQMIHTEYNTHSTWETIILKKNQVNFWMNFFIIQFQHDLDLSLYKTLGHRCFNSW